jgi:predicted TIM-barrel fold metal-dependent hydrolase
MTVIDKQASAATDGTATKPLVIDTDIHEAPKSLNDFVPDLEPQWSRVITDWGYGSIPTSSPYINPSPGKGARLDWRPDDGSKMGSDLDHLRKHLLEGEGVDIGILNGSVRMGILTGWIEFATALARAYNDWQVEHWLEQEPRLRGAIHVAPRDPQTAAREIDRLGEHPQMVQVFLPLVTDIEFGDPFFRPIFEAASRHNLVIAMHHDANTKSLLGSGFPRYFIEWHVTAAPQAMMSQLVSLVFNGVFDRFENLKVSAVEGGFSWMPHFMWRMDQNYRQLRHEVPWVKRMPSEVLRSHVRLGTQPIEDISKEHFLQLVDQMGSDRMLMISSDYPHWDSDSVLNALPAGLPNDLRRRILGLNAAETFGIS